MSRILTNDPTSLTTDRLVLRSWTSAEAAAVLGDHRQSDWADDFPSEGDKVIVSGGYGLPDKTKVRIKQ